MKIYKVGGAVRDLFLDLPVEEIDWVVIGATVKQMEFLGYKRVGKSFPVFIHPQTGDEYALARKEQKISRGHKGFKFEFHDDISLEEDLQRRDLTINAIAKDDRGKVYDHVGGKKDLQRRCLRHISKAFVEDPLRVLRVARFMAKLAHLKFKVAPETLKLMQKMVRGGELSTLTKERVWGELYKVLKTQTPVVFFETLQASGARLKLFPGVKKPALLALKKATQISKDPEIRFATLMFQYTNFSRGLSFKAPKRYIELAKMVSQHHQQVDKIKKLSSNELLNFLLKLDALRRPKRFEKFIMASEAIYLSNPRRGKSKMRYWQSDYLLGAREMLASIDISDLIVKGFSGKTLANKIKDRRITRLSDIEIP